MTSVHLQAVRGPDLVMAALRTQVQIAVYACARWSRAERRVQWKLNQCFYGPPELLTKLTEIEMHMEVGTTIYIASKMYRKTGVRDCGARRALRAKSRAFRRFALRGEAHICRVEHSGLGWAVLHGRDCEPGPQRGCAGGGKQGRESRVG